MLRLSINDRRQLNDDQLQSFHAEPHELDNAAHCHPYHSGISQHSVLLQALYVECVLVLVYAASLNSTNSRTCSQGRI